MKQLVHRDVVSSVTSDKEISDPSLLSVAGSVQQCQSINQCRVSSRGVTDTVNVCSPSRGYHEHIRAARLKGGKGTVSGMLIIPNQRLSERKTMTDLLVVHLIVIFQTSVSTQS